MAKKDSKKSIKKDTGADVIVFERKTDTEQKANIVAMDAGEQETDTTVLATREQVTGDVVEIDSAKSEKPVANNETAEIEGTDEITIAQSTTEETVKLEIASEEEKVKKLEEDLEHTTRELEEIQSSENHFQNEDLMVQEKHWMEERARKERESEDLVRKELFEKQKLIEQMRREQAEKFVQNKQMTLYNHLHEEEQKEQIYALHGITTDKVEGMVEYKNAVYQGAVFSMFMMALALCAYIGYIEGVDTKIFFAMLALAGAESTVLLHERDGKLQGGLYGIVCKLFGVLTTPVMLFLYTVYELRFIDMSVTLCGCAVYAILMYLVGSADFFLRNPYRGTKRAAREARMEMKNMKRTAAKNVKKNQKLREKMENKLIKKKENQERKLEEAKLKEKQKTERLIKKLEMQKQKQAEYEAVATIRRENKAKRAELRNQKLVAFKTRVADWTNKKNA